MATPLPFTHSPPIQPQPHQNHDAEVAQDAESSLSSLSSHDQMDRQLSLSDTVQASCPKCAQFWEYGRCSPWYRHKYDHVGNAKFNVRVNDWLHEFPYYDRWFRFGWPSSFEHWIHTERLWGYPSAPVLYLASRPDATSPMTSTTMLLDGPDAPPALTEALTKASPGSTNVFLLSDLNLVTMDRIGSLFSIHPSVFLKQINTLARLDEEIIKVFSYMSPHHVGMVPTSNTSTFDCPGDLWALSQASCIPKATEGTFGAREWPLDVSWTNRETFIGSFTRNEADATATSRTTFHVWTSGDNITNVLVLVRPWHRVKGAIMKRTSADLGFEYGHASCLWTDKLLHVDGDPLHEAAPSIHSSDKDTHFCFDAAYRDLCERLAFAASAIDQSPNSAMDGMVDFAWSRTAERLDILLQRSLYRLKAFRHSRHHPHLNQNPRDRSSLLRAIVFLERNLLQQLESIDSFRLQLDQRSARHEQVQSQDTRQRARMDRLTARLKDMIEQCQTERNLYERKQQEDLTRLQLEESRKSIEQTDQVKKLTILAFFFIPVSCVTSAFGMNLDVYDRKPPTIVSFVAATLVVTGVTLILALLPTFRQLDAGIRARLWQKLASARLMCDRRPQLLSFKLRFFALWVAYNLYVVVLTGPVRGMVKAADVCSTALHELRLFGQKMLDTGG